MAHQTCLINDNRPTKEGLHLPTKTSSSKPQM